MSPIYTAFYTTGTLYEQEAARLRRSLDRLGLEHDLRAIPSRGDWKANSRYTADHVCNVLADYPERPVVQLDADAVVWRRPILFEAITDDIAAHWRRGTELLNGTIYFAPTAAARLIAERYRQLVAADEQCRNEQIKLAEAITQLAGQFSFYHLPASYCWIHDIMKDDLVAGDDPVIEHLQASRVASQSHLLPSRLKRLAEIEAQI